MGGTSAQLPFGLATPSGQTHTFAPLPRHPAFPLMPRNETQARRELAAPCLVAERGWPRANIRVEVTAAAPLRQAFAGQLS